MNKIMNYKDFVTKTHEFLKKITEKLDDHKIKLAPHWDIDHICYRSSSQENYEEMFKQFSLWGSLLIESEVNGRLIATFKLQEPILFHHYRDYKIDVLELPAPKMNKKTKEGFEHIEVVCDLSFEEIKAKYAGLKFDESGLKKSFNQELRIVFDDSCSIKFHHMSLESVICLEGSKNFP
jgi:hypothetical protein